MDNDSKDSQQSEEAQAAAPPQEAQAAAPPGEVSEEPGGSEAAGSGPDDAPAASDQSPGESAAESGAEEGQEPEDEVEALRAQAKRTHDRLLRTAADFENFRRRARRDAQSAVAQAEEKIASRFLPIIDNLERAIAHGHENGQTDDSQSLLDGVKMVHRQFLVALGECEMEPFESVGEVFDPELHEAIQQAESDAPRNTVTLEVQKGYRRGQRLVRPAMVVVSGGPAGADGTENDAE